MVTFLWRAAGSPEPKSTENPFSDVKTSYYYKAVLWAVEQGITKGVTDTTFNPNGTVTRAQAVTFLYRFANGSVSEKSSNPFTDVSNGSYYYKAVLWAKENNITGGMDSTHFVPGKGCTRAQIVTFLYRCFR